MDSYTLFEMCWEACSINYLENAVELAKNPKVFVDFVKDNLLDIGFYSALVGAIYILEKEAVKAITFTEEDLDTFLSEIDTKQ